MLWSTFILNTDLVPEAAWSLQTCFFVSNSAARLQTLHTLKNHYDHRQPLSLLDSLVQVNHHLLDRHVCIMPNRGDMRRS